MEKDIKIIEEKMEIIEHLCTDDCINKTTVIQPLKYALENLIKRYKELEEKYKRLSIEAQATAFDDENKDTEGLLRVLLKQGEITLDKKGYYQREAFDWEENMYMLGLMKKREKGFYFPDDECLGEYTKQLENQLQEYNEIKEIFKKYICFPNDTMYDGCCKMQDEIDKLKEQNGELQKKIKELEELL